MPQYTIGNDLIYTTQRPSLGWKWILYFENKDIRASSNNVARIDASTEIYNSYLYTNARANFPYSVFEDVNRLCGT
jgi:hypothetical protein